MWNVKQLGKRAPFSAYFLITKYFRDLAAPS